MPAENHFYSPRLLLAEGRDDTHRLSAAVREFLARTGHFHVPRFDLEKRVYVHKVQFEEPLPQQFPVFVRKIAGSLRSALDHAIYASAVSLGNPNLKAIGFPFGDTPDQLENDIKRKCRGMAPEIIAILKGFRPYKGANDDLWALNKLRNVKEHRLLVAPALAGGMMFPFPFAVAGKRLRILDAGPANAAHWDDVDKTLTFQTLPISDQIEKKLTFFLTFGDIDGVAGEHLIPKLEAFALIVENCVDRIEEETGRLLRLK
jgi:hypothetical protein